MTTAKLKISKHVTIDVPDSANLATLMKPAAISQNGKSIMVTDAMQNYVIAAFDRHADNA